MLTLSLNYFKEQRKQGVALSLGSRCFMAHVSHFWFDVNMIFSVVLILIYFPGSTLCSSWCSRNHV